jgi:hypothetical protein
MLPVDRGDRSTTARGRPTSVHVAELRTNNGGPETEWRDVIWEFLAIGDPAAAKSAWDGSGGNYEPEWGETKAHTYHWIYNLAATGMPDHSVTADVPTYAVFNRSGTRTYVAHNASGTARTVRFSDGTSLSVPARSTATKVGSGGSDPPPSGSDTLYLRDGGAESVTAPLSATAGSSATTDTIPSADGTNHDGTPYKQLTYLATGLTMTYDPARSTRFTLYVDAGTIVANGQQARISYDLTGDGSWDRVETYRYFATDPVVGWEAYTQSAGLHSASGTLGNLSNGRVRIEVWSAIGSGPSTLRVDASASQGSQSVVVIPYG